MKASFITIHREIVSLKFCLSFSVYVTSLSLRLAFSNCGGYLGILSRPSLAAHGRTARVDDSPILRVIYKYTVEAYGYAIQRVRRTPRGGGKL